MSMAPQWYVAAYVRGLLYEREGLELRGTQHFAPGTLVYVDPPYSGDGWERTHFTGPHRDGGRLVSVLSPRRRLVHAHRARVTDDAVLRKLTRLGNRWASNGPFTALLEAHGEDPLDDTRRAGWPDGAWERVTDAALSPARAELTACIAAVLDVSTDEAQRLVDEGHAGRALRDCERGVGPVGAAPIRSARAAFEQLAATLGTSPARRIFLRDDGRECESPASLTAVASFCADLGAVRTAEALARELASRAKMNPDARIAWRVVARTDAYRRASALDPAAPSRTVSAVVASILPAISQANVAWRADAVAALAALGLDAEAVLEPLFALTALGYAVESLSHDQTVLSCPLVATRGPA